MVLRMYQRWAENRGLKFELLDATPGEEAGLKSATFAVRGENAYGILQAEKGVHRLVRLSPFDSAHRRQTSFAKVELSPEVTDDVDVEIEDKDLRIDTYRAQGAGGQHVNKTDSAVRLTHLPTGIVVQCQNERSQLQNRVAAMRVLKGRLIENERELREATLARERGESVENSFGSQIRNYVLHPYTMVTDVRTGRKEGNAQGVLDGNLDEFISRVPARARGRAAAPGRRHRQRQRRRVAVSRKSPADTGYLRSGRWWGRCYPSADARGCTGGSQERRLMRRIGRCTLCHSRSAGADALSSRAVR